MDSSNERLVNNCHPADWVNPAPADKYNLVVMGAGTAGLVTAAGAAGLGAKVALVERHLLGGDCLNVGCVPSKCIIRSSRAYADVLDASQYGVKISGTAEVDFGAMMERMRHLRSSISVHDSAERFKNMGVDIFFGHARFSGPDTVEVGDQTLCFAKAVITSGARAVNLEIEGLDEADFLTNETVFSLTERPDRLVVLGGGPLGCELAQAFCRSGCKVTIIERAGQILTREDPDAARIIADSLDRDGVKVVLNSTVKRVVSGDDGKTLEVEGEDGVQNIPADKILAAAGRAPNVEDMNLEAVGVEYDSRGGVIVDDHLCTTNRKIYAAGDVCMKYKFTHTADAAARIVIQNALFRGRKRLSALTIPWCTYTDPEIAHVGMYEHDAEERGIPVQTFEKRFDDIDRAIADGEENGLVKVHVRKGSDKILGATIVARHAGEMINELTLAMVGNLGLGTIANVIHPYPTQAEAIKQVGDAYNRTRLTPFVKKFLSKWLEWQR